MFKFIQDCGILVLFEEQYIYSGGTCTIIDCWAKSSWQFIKFYIKWTNWSQCFDEKIYNYLHVCFEQMIKSSNENGFIIKDNLKISFNKK